MNRFTGTLFLPASTVIVGLFLGCSSYDSTPEVVVGPAGFGVGSVASVQSGGTVTKDGATLALDCTEPLLVSVLPELSADHLGDFRLAPPGDCGSTVNCGWLVLSVRDAAKKTLSVGFDTDGKALKQILSATSPIRVDLPAARRNETLTFHLELRDADGADVLTADDDVLSDEFVVTLATARSTCSPIKYAIK